MGFKDFVKAVNCSKNMWKNAVNPGVKVVNGSSNKTLHVSAAQKYPTAAALPIPVNIDPSETTRFSPQRSRDISATAILSHQSTLSKTNTIDITLDNSMITNATLSTTTDDPHVDSYDCFGSVSLNSSMQSNVPSPLGGLHKFTHLNMPGGQWSQDSKFMSHNLHSSHYTNLRREARASWSNYDQDAIIEKGIKQIQLLKNNNNNNTSNARYYHHNHCNNNKFHYHNDCQKFLNPLINFFPANSNKMYSIIRSFSTDNKQELKDIPNKIEASDNKLTKKEKLKKAFKEYGTTVIVFHVGISLMSLGMFYLLVSSGVDLVPIVEKLGLSSTTALSSKTATGAGTFVIAYAIHKVFAPVRISITLGATPFIVRYLRQKGFLKPTKTN